MDFSQYAAILLDLDGTIYHDDQAIPGAIELVRAIQSAGYPFACLTNGTSSPQYYNARLRRMGVEVEADHIYSAAAAAVDYAVEHFGAGKPRVFNLSTDGVDQMLEGRATPVNTADESCDVVIAGTSTNTFATEDRQRIALRLLRQGAGLIGICPDRVYPSPRGVEFGSGAFTQMLAYAANIKPVFTGKPDPNFFKELCTRLKVAPEKCILIGDNLESDIGGAKRMGMKTVLTMTGVTDRAQLKAAAPEQTPDFVVDNLTGLWER